MIYDEERMVEDSEWRSSWCEAAFERQSLPEVERCKLGGRKGEVVKMEGWDGMIVEGGGCQWVFQVERAVSKAELSNER